MPLQTPAASVQYVIQRLQPELAAVAMDTTATHRAAVSVELDVPQTTDQII